MNSAAALRSMHVQGIDLEVLEKGSGPALLFLHGANALSPEAPFLDSLAARFRVVAPSHPGFGRSSLPDSFDSVADLAYFYLDLIDELHLDGVTLMGASFGGWIAAEIAVRCSHRLERLILVDPLGIKVSGRETRDIADIFALSQSQVTELSYHDPAAALLPDLPTMSDEELAVIARNRESLALFMWEPYAHNPKLLQSLHRISVPALLIWGESDGIVTPAYGAAYRDAIPGAKLEIIPEAGHLPHEEQPSAFIEAVFAYLAEH